MAMNRRPNWELCLLRSCAKVRIGVLNINVGLEDFEWGWIRRHPRSVAGIDVEIRFNPGNRLPVCSATSFKTLSRALFRADL